jgi:hypothetical protein
MMDFITEELADAANYLRYLYIKLRLLGVDQLRESSIDRTAQPASSEYGNGVRIGSTQFIPSQNVHGAFEG